MNNANIKTDFWLKPDIFSLKTPEKFLSIYLRTNTYMNLAGIYPIGIHIICNETGFTESQVVAALEKLEKLGLVVYFDGYVIIRNLVWERFYSLSMKINVGKTIDSLPLDFFTTEKLEHFLAPTFKLVMYQSIELKNSDKIASIVNKAVNQKKPAEQPKAKKDILLIDIKKAPEGPTAEIKYKLWAWWFWNELKEFHGGKKTFDNAKLSVWEKDFRLLIESDNRPGKQIKEVVTFIIKYDTDSIPYVMSPSYFRKKGGANYDRSLSKMERHIAKGQNIVTGKLNKPKNPIAKPLKHIQS